MSRKVYETRLIEVPVDFEYMLGSPVTEKNPLPKTGGRVRFGTDWTDEMLSDFIVDGYERKFGQATSSIVDGAEVKHEGEDIFVTPENCGILRQTKVQNTVTRIGSGKTRSSGLSQADRTFLNELNGRLKKEGVAKDDLPKSVSKSRALYKEVVVGSTDEILDARHAQLVETFKNEFTL